MKIVTWNCNGAFRRKLAAADSLDADLLVIQECENPALATEAYQAWAGEHAWLGSNKNRGLGVFPRRGQKITPLAWPDFGLRLFLPVRIDDEYDLVGVWTQRDTNRGFSYIGQFWHYLQGNKANLGGQTIIAGDFNSNVRWDKSSRYWNHSDCVRELAALGFESLYHLATGEEQGNETHPTLYLQRNEAKPYHIDYIFARLAERSLEHGSMSVGGKRDWLSQSDHMPVAARLIGRG